MKKFLIQSVMLLVLILIAVAIFIGKITTLHFLPQQAKFGEVIVNEAKLKVEIADTQPKRSKGLGGRASLAEGTGMLFIFPKEDKYPFWMKGVSFPLDFIWIKGGQVVDFLENVSPAQTGQKDADLPIYVPKEPVDKVLEVNAGTISRLKIKIGDKLSLNQ